MRNIIIFFLGSFTGVILLVSLILLQEGTPTSSSKWASDLYRAKEQHASKSTSEKLLIVAGSNSLFGIHSLELERNYHLPVTNFGVHAGLGLKYILDRSKKSLKAGDFVYLPLEYALYQQESAPSTQLMDFLLARDPEYFHRLSITQQIQGYVSVPFSRILEGLMGGSDEYLGSSSKTYNIRNIDGPGNQIKNSPELAKNHALKLSNLGPKSFGDGDISDYSKKLLTDYIEWTRKNGVCLIPAPPNLMSHEEYSSGVFPAFTQKIKQFYADMEIHFIGEPENYLFPKHLFFDTEYHLNTAGVAMRTALTIEDLGDNLATHCDRQSG